MSVYDLLCLGIGPKTIAVFTKMACIPEDKMVPLRIMAVEKNCVAGNWLPSGGLTTGGLKLGTRPEKDLVYPMNLNDDLGGAELLRNCREFTWQNYLLSRGAYSNWVDMGVSAPTHFEWSRYLSWSLQAAVDRCPETLRTQHGEVQHIEAEGDLWAVTIGHEDGARSTVLAKNILLTGPGQPKPLSSDGSECFQKAAWGNLSDLAAQECVVVVGGGESACSLVQGLLALACDRLQIILVAPMGVRPRDQSYEENRYFSDAERNGWTRMTEAERRAFVRRADNGVCSPETYDVLVANPQVTILSDKVKRIQWADPGGNRVCVEFENRKTPILASAAINCAGFDHRGFLASLCSPDSALGHLLRRAAPLEVDAHLRIKGNFPGVFLPMFGMITEGPGYTNLSCLGSLSDIVISALLSGTTTTSPRIPAFEKLEYGGKSSVASINRVADSSSYYLGENGNGIMDVANFDNKIHVHLEREAAHICDLLNGGTYEVFVELGCDRARSLALAERCAMEYIGVDCREELRPFQEILSSRSPRPARLEIGCLSRLPDYLGPKYMARKERILCVFPFNLIGNIGDFEEVLRRYADAGLDIALSNFNCAPCTTEIRRQYYTRCNIRNLMDIATAEGVLFSNFKDFYSFSYHENTLHTLLARSGYSIVRTENAYTTLFLHCQPHARACSKMGVTSAAQQVAEGIKVL